MKIIKLLLTSATITITIGGNDNADQHQTNHLRRLSDADAPPPPPPPAPANSTPMTCAADETPCHAETGSVLSCAKEGEECPCFYNEEQCHDSRFGEYCDTVCCEWGVQERCHYPDPNDKGYFDVSCAYIADGGCGCPANQTKCGEEETADGGVINGYCTDLCCDGDDETTCYDSEYNPSHCALISEGGCPCPDGQVRCGGNANWAGYCSAQCCASEEETCHDDQGNKSCAKEGCEESTSHRYWQSRIKSTILSKGTGSQIEYYSRVKNRKDESSAFDSLEGKLMMKELEAEEAALFHSIRVQHEQRLAKKKEAEMFTTSIA